MHGVGCRAVVNSDLRYLAFYLPQFHPIPENDQWWGEGFTEWTNVRKGNPLFTGHHQPHAPAAELGYYDLRDAQTREKQADLARAHGIDGFVYYHYWFNGRRLLERPFNAVLASGSPSLPFCLCWANENWTSSWNAHDPTTVLVAQQYGDDDDRAHLRWLAEAFRDPRYIRVDGRPLFLVYHASAMPDSRRTTDNWRDEAQRLGFDGLYLCRVESFDRGDPAPLGFDAAVEFWPNWKRMGPRLRLADRELTDAGRIQQGDRTAILLSYPVAMELAGRYADVPFKRYPCVMTGWDNTPRRGNAGTVFVGSSPEQYAAWLAATIKRFTPYSPSENLIFINAWNEWAEGAHLEPDERWSRAYLEAHHGVTGRAIASTA
ncbi:MAG: glycoside hydrolase family 99-like domain-containing protein [Candidatus Dormibacteraeota bacterium]|nr:glycoside hydrolase family 99-like domain-containing protein [Candidatus Dormibacteraeota bacterium]